MKLQVMKFHADWCGPCRDLVPVWNEIKAKPEFQEHYEFIEHDVVANKEVSREYSIEGLPTVLILKDGKIKRRYEGYPMPLENNLNRFLENPDTAP